MGRYGGKTAITLAVSKDEAQTNLDALRLQWGKTEKELAELVKCLHWFRMYRAYKHFGHSTFEQFLNAEIGRSRKWLYRHLKTLPIEADERRLLEHKSGTPCPKLGSPNRVPDSANAVSGKMGNCNKDGLSLTQKQRLEVAKLSPFGDQEKAIEALIEQCPGANLETTKAVIEKTIGKKSPKSKPVRKKKLDAPDPADQYHETMTRLGTQFIKQGKAVEADIARSGASVIGAAIQTLRVLAKAIKGYSADCPF